MTLVTPPQAPQTPQSILVPRRGSTSRKIRNRIAVIAIMAAFVIALIPLIAIVWYVIKRGAAILDWDFLTDPIPISDREIGPGHGPRRDRHAAHHGSCCPDGDPRRHPRRDLPQRVRRSRHPRARDPVPRRGDDRRAVGGDGPLRLHLRRVAHAGAERACRRTGPRLPHAADRDPHHRRDAAARAERAARGELRARVPQGAHDPHRRVPERDARHRERRRCSRSHAPRARPHPLLFTIGIVTETNTSLFDGPNTTLSYQIFRNAASPFPGAQDRAWGAALTLIAIVFIFTALARLATTFFARRQAA